MILELKKIFFAYHQIILSNVDLELNKGDIISVSGKAGSGKSTFLKVAAGLIAPHAGEVLLLGKDIWALNDSDRMALLNKISFFFEEGALIANMNIFDNLALRLRYHRDLGRVELEQRILPWLERFNLTDYTLQLPAMLTLELRRKVALIRTLLADNPLIYFWDSPRVFDASLQKIVENAVTEGSKMGRASIISGNEDWIQKISQRHFNLEDGKFGRNHAL